MNKVFAQQNKEKEWASIPVFAAVKAFYERGFEIIPYQYEDVSNLKIEQDDIAIGGIPCVREILAKWNIIPPVVSLPHDSLLRYCDRNFWITTVEEINKSFYKDTNEKIFIKPLLEHKSFNGHVVNEFKDLFKTMHLDKATKIVASDVVDFSSEYRIFLTNGEIVGMSHYHGNPLLFPNKEIIKSLVIDAYKAYKFEGLSVDIGVTEDNRTLLIEINDGFSLGTYGLNYFVYSKLIEERWKQPTSYVSS